MTHPLDEDGLRRDPRDTRNVKDKRTRQPFMWWYEERGGITVVTCNEQGFIPLADLRRTLKRLEQMR